MGENRYHTQGLRDSGDGLHGVSEQLRQEWKSLDDHVTAQGDIFGDDDVGGLLAIAYQVIHAKAGESYTQAADDFDGLGTGLRSVGDTYDELEKQHIETLDIINKALDGIQPKKA